MEVFKPDGRRDSENSSGDAPQQLKPGDVPTIAQLGESHSDIVAELRRLDFVKTVTTFGGLLSVPELQANCFRIEVMVHLAAAYCAGSAAPTRAFVLRTFERLGAGDCGITQDPAEDVFVSLVSTPCGNFRILEGIREGTGFYLQRILNVLEHVPNGPHYIQLHESVACLLRLADDFAARSDLHENSLGHEMPVDSIPKRVADRLSSVRHSLRFNEEDLARLNIDKQSLRPFAFDINNSPKLHKQMIGHTDIERTRLAFVRQYVYLLLPTAIATAITRFVIDTILAIRKADAFEKSLAREYLRLFETTPILGGSSLPQIGCRKVQGGWISTIVEEVDSGRFLHLVFFVDGLDDFPGNGLNGSNAHSDALAPLR